MSVLVTVKIKGDTAAFRQALADRAGEFEKISAASRAQGAIHHRFGLGDGFVLVVDEWESPGHFEQFFSNPDLQGFIASVGAAAEPPEITVAETVASADQF
jgi:quinol monooxygenase YgiN